MRQEMEVGGRVLHQLLDKVEEKITPGITTKEIDEWIETFIYSHEVKTILACKGFHNYPCGSCISVNENIIHGLPGKKIIKEGDLVKVDVVLEYQGWFVDSARTYICGKGKEEDIKLMSVCKECLDKGIAVARAGNTTGHIGFVIEKHANRNGFEVIKEYSGHGIGQEIHMDPRIPCFGKKRKGELLEKGMYICIEPMLFAGSPKIIQSTDGWTVKAKDNCSTAHFENTILINKKGLPTIIT